MCFINTQGMSRADCLLTSISGVQLATGASQQPIYFNGNYLKSNQIEGEIALVRLFELRSNHSVLSVLQVLQKLAGTKQ